jgi:ABC-type polar amino acid transport system ATPase subunit
MSRVVLSISGLRLSRGGQPVLRGVDLEVRQGEFVALMGLSGGGKTTVLRAVVGLEPFDAGEIALDGLALRSGPLPREARLRPLRRQVGIVFQFHHLFAHLSALENVVLAPVRAHGVARQAAEARARELLDSLGVLARADALPGALSGGEAQRVAIARALATDPPLLLLDEPTASLDPARRGELGQTLQGLRASGRTLLLTTHDYGFVRSFATRVVILAEGAVVEEGDPAQVLEHPSHPATKQLLQSKPPRAGASPSPRQGVSGAVPY